MASTSLAKVAVLGAGAWGATLAKLAADNHRPVSLWTRNERLAEVLRAERTRNRPPGLILPDHVDVTCDLQWALNGADLVVVAISSSGLRELFGHMEQILRGKLSPDLGKPDAGIAVLCASKGLEQGTGLLPTQVFEQIFGVKSGPSFVALGGPSHAEEVGGAKPMPTAVVAAGEEWAVERVRAVYNRRYFRVYSLHKDPRRDCLAVELGGALKNIIAIAAGICVGMKYGDNTQAAIISRGLREITRAVRQIYPDLNPDILAGIAGLGDLVGTAMSVHSRNRQFGKLLAEDHTPQQAFAKVGQVVEGAYAARAMYQLAVKHGVHMPLTKLVHDVIHEAVPLKAAVDELLRRDTGPEDL
jgi:glycerol-3-phosphate dehydrogenase (NAD(P)+)